MSGRTTQVLLIAALGALLYLPNLGRAELDKEEARRAIPAREMIASGDFVLPTIWQRPYLSKPPLYFWSVAAAARVTGSVDELATRLPSALCTVLTALLVYLLLDRAAGRGVALTGALLHLLGFASLEKGIQGELEPMLIATAFASGAFLWLGRGRRLAWELLSGLALGLALLTKGPPALVFFGAAAIAARRDRSGPSPARVWIPLALGLALAGVWVAALLARSDAQTVIAHWWGQQTQRGPHGYWTDRLDFVIGYGAGLLPSVLFLLLVGPTPTGRAALREPFVRFALGTFAIASLLFLVYPGTRPRYAYPAAPWCTAAAAVVLVRALVAGDATAVRRLRAVSAPLLAVGLAALPLATWLLVGSIGPVSRLGPAGWAAVAAMGLLSAGGFWRWRRDRAWTGLGTAAALLVLVRVVQMTEVVPQTAHLLGRVEAARPLAEALPASADVRLHVPKHWNQLFYAGRPLRWIEDYADLRPGQWLVVPCRDAEPARAAYPGALESRLRTDLDGLEVCVLEAR